MIRHRAYLVIVLGSLTLVACRRQAETSPSPLQVPADPCPTKETYSPESDIGPELLSIEPLRLGAELQRELKGAQVIVSTLIDGAGRPVACTITIVQSTDSRLNEPARRAILRARYRPARLHGLPVPTWLNQPVWVW